MMDVVVDQWTKSYRNLNLKSIFYENGIVLFYQGSELITTILNFFEMRGKTLMISHLLSI
ncbi:unnamed protein product [Paramecium octaurelia]|uniref:Uncharacterized protein n=1 Tax=Paramecium octaurelia TaxID=43137 RepID=A0A8S1SHE8_PAROT|nr:unnamed protein product [Paramecium octaurelia]